MHACAPKFMHVVVLARKVRCSMQLSGDPFTVNTVMHATVLAPNVNAVMLSCCIVGSMQLSGDPFTANSSRAETEHGGYSQPHSFTRQPSRHASEFPPPVGVLESDDFGDLRGISSSHPGMRSVLEHLVCGEGEPHTHTHTQTHSTQSKERGANTMSVPLILCA